MVDFLISAAILAALLGLAALLYQLFGRVRP